MRSKVPITPDTELQRGVELVSLSKLVSTDYVGTLGSKKLRLLRAALARALQLDED